jgi:hypothetical protein
MRPRPTRPPARALKNEIIPAIHYTEGWEGAISSFWQKVKLTIPTLEDLPRPIALTSQALEEMGIKTTVFKDLPDQAKTARVSIDDLSTVNLAARADFRRRILWHRAVDRHADWGGVHVP